MAPARPVNNEGQQDRSAAENPYVSGADAGPTPSSGPPRQSSRRSAVPPDDRLTTILPPVRDEAPNRFRDPIEAVKAAVCRAVKKASQRIWDRRPIVEATVLRV